MFAFSKTRFQHPTTEMLAVYLPFQHLGQDDLSLLQQKSLLQTAKKGATLFKAGSSDDWTYFLVQGEIQLQDTSGNTVLIQAGSEPANSALSNLQPRRYSATARSTIQYIKLDKTLLQNIQPDKPFDFLGDNNVLRATYDSNALFKRIYDDLSKDRLIFPSFADLTTKIRKLMESSDQNIEHILRVIQVDPILSARLIRAANGPLYYGKEAVDSCNKAILRIGLIPAKSLCVSYLLQDAFSKDLKHSHIQKLAMQVWLHSVDVAAIAFVLAHIVKGFNAEQAMLAGLVHDIGALPVLYYADKFPGLLSNPAAVESTMRQLQGEVGAILLKKWRFPPEFITVARESEQWQRQPPSADYCDVVMVAQLHSAVGKKPEGTPRLFEVPALTRLHLTGLTPQHSLRVLDEAHQQIQKAKQLLG